MVLPARPLPPLYYRIFKTLEQRIHDQQYGPGDRLPSEDRLCQEFRVSRMTIRQALAGLVHGGLLTRRRGSGSFVTEAVLGGAPARALTGRLEDLLARVETAQVKHLRMTEELPQRDVQEAMQLRKSQPVTMIRRVRAIHGRPFSVTVSYLPPRLGRRLDEADLWRFPLRALLEERLRVVLLTAEQTFEARFADEEIARDLEIDFGDPVLFVELRMFGAGGRLIDLVRSSYRTQLYRYQIRFVRSRGRLGPWQPDASLFRSSPEPASSEADARPPDADDRWRLV
jgi:GntR family transcriptional regulator